MNMTFRRLIQGTPILRNCYVTARDAYHVRRMGRAARGNFANVQHYRQALQPGGEGTVDIRTMDGLVLTVRKGSMDAENVAEIFLDNCYVRDLLLPDRPVVVDIGGYTGDFAVYAASRLNARRVVTCEPSPHNWLLLKKNVTANHYDDRVVMLNKAVTEGGDVMMNTDAPGRDQARVSAYGPTDRERTAVPGITLESIIRDYNLEVIDLLKLDCEGSEYSILLTATSEIYRRIRNIVFECHEIEGFQSKLSAVRQRLVDEGFSVQTRGSLVSASRDGFAETPAECALA